MALEFRELTVMVTWRRHSGTAGRLAKAAGRWRLVVMMLATENDDLDPA